MFTAVATTLWTTVLIGYRIYSLSNDGIQKQSKHRLYNVLQIFLQSSFIYSLALVASAVPLAIPETGSDFLPLLRAGSYILTTVMAITVFMIIYDL